MGTKYTIFPKQVGNCNDNNKQLVIIVINSTTHKGVTTDNIIHLKLESISYLFSVFFLVWFTREKGEKKGKRKQKSQQW